MALCLGAAFWCWLQPGNAQIVTNLGQSGKSGVGTESAPQTLALSRTAAAPYGAEGSVALQSSNSPAGARLVIAVETQGLTPGKYRLQYAEVPNGLWGDLGVIMIRDPDATPDVEAGDSRKEDSTTHHAEGIKSRITMVFPADVAPSRIRYIRLTDLGGTVLLQSKTG